jgi:ABC-type Mn2+/Zn2+ transport system ATPase subunit
VAVAVEHLTAEQPATVKPVVVMEQLTTQLVATQPQQQDQAAVQVALLQAQAATAAMVQVDL